MDRSGLNTISEASLCLQDLVGGGENANNSINNNSSNNSTNNNSNTSSNSNSTNNQNNLIEHLHSHHHSHSIHDSNISVSHPSALSNLMSPTNLGSIGITSGISHLHNSHSDLSSHHHHHHISTPHTPSVLHEPLEKLKRK